MFTFNRSEYVLTYYHRTTFFQILCAIGMINITNKTNVPFRKKVTQ